MRGVGILWRHGSRRRFIGPSCVLQATIFVDVETRGVILWVNIEARDIVLRIYAKPGQVTAEEEIDNRDISD